MKAVIGECDHVYYLNFFFSLLYFSVIFSFLSSFFFVSFSENRTGNLVTFITLSLDTADLRFICEIGLSIGRICALRFTVLNAEDLVREVLFCECGGYPLSPSTRFCRYTSFSRT